jgi:protein O-GlcNAc transferase
MGLEGARLRAAFGNGPVTPPSPHLQSVVARIHVVAESPDRAETLHELGCALQEHEAFDGALACFERSALLDPSLPELHERTAKLRAATQAARSAEPQEAAARDPARREHREAADVLSGMTLLALARPVALEGRLPEAIEMLERAVLLHPRLTAAHCNLGMLSAALGRVRDACTHYRHALAIEPGRTDVHHSLANALLRGGMLDEALDAFRNAIAQDPTRASFHSDLVFHLHFHPAYDARAILAEARRWDLAHAKPLRDAPREPAFPDGKNEARAGASSVPRAKRLRIGYVSPNFRLHCQAFFLSPLLAHHDHGAFEIVCYSDVAQPDEWTRRLLAHADRTHAVSAMSHEALAEQIAADGIDILVDLTMHMADNRLLVFARKPAPVQVCWLAYPGTTGLSTMDYRLSDPYLDPPDGDPSAYAERLLRLPETFWCYDPLPSRASGLGTASGPNGASGPSVGELPARRNGHITLGSLNNVLKVTRGTIALWSRVLRELDGSRMTLLAPFGDARERTARLFEEQGIARERLRFVEYQPREAYLATYQSIDLCLDTLPYNGHTTSLDAFWMGVPVVTLVGSTIVGRAGLSQAMNLGLPELVARTPDEFVSIAAGLAGNVDGLADLREALRSRMERSPLMDGPRFARNLEAAYRRIAPY